jgi:SWI/SNF-related matrix-associated actin-dependent regulator of chromatin subfamily A3
MAATLESAVSFAETPLPPITPPPERADSEPAVSASDFAGSVWGMPGFSETGHDTSSSSAKGKAKAAKLHEKLEANYIRVSRIKSKSRATLIVCPLSTVANWEDQFREHWRGEVCVFGGAGGCASTSTTAGSQASASQFCQNRSATSMPLLSDVKVEAKPGRVREGRPLRVYVYHGNARRPDPAFLADFDAVITTYATLATEFSKQSKSTANFGANDDDDDVNSDPGGIEFDERGNQFLRLPQLKKNPLKRKKMSLAALAVEAASALQSVYWFRVVLDEAQ